MTQKQFDSFIVQCREILIKEQEDYKKKKINKGEKVDFGKMGKAINKRKKIKQLNKIMQSVMFKTFEDTREMINKFKEEHKEEIVFYVGGSLNSTNKSK